MKAQARSSRLEGSHDRRVAPPSMSAELDAGSVTAVSPGTRGQSDGFCALGALAGIVGTCLVTGALMPQLFVTSVGTAQSTPVSSPYFSSTAAATAAPDSIAVVHQLPLVPSQGTEPVFKNRWECRQLLEGNTQDRFEVIGWTRAMHPEMLPLESKSPTTPAQTWRSWHGERGPGYLWS